MLSIRSNAKMTWDSVEDTSKLQVITASKSTTAFYYAYASGNTSMFDIWGGYYVQNISPAVLCDTFNLNRNVDFTISGEKVASLTASDKTFDYENDVKGYKFKFIRKTGIFSGKANAVVEGGTTVSGKFEGVLLPGWIDCGCGNDIVVLPFGSGTFYWKQKINGKSVIQSCPVHINAVDLLQ